MRVERERFQSLLKALSREELLSLAKGPPLAYGRSMDEIEWLVHAAWRESQHVLFFLAGVLGIEQGSQVWRASEVDFKRQEVRWRQPTDEEIARVSRRRLSGKVISEAQYLSLAMALTGYSPGSGVIH